MGNLLQAAGLAALLTGAAVYAPSCTGIGQDTVYNMKYGGNPVVGAAGDALSEFYRPDGGFIPLGKGLALGGLAALAIGLIAGGRRRRE